MKPRYRIYRRQGGVFYLFDRHTGKRESLETADQAAAQRLLHAKNEAQQQPLINRQIARAYLAVGDPEITRRTWRDVLVEIIKLKHHATQQRWITAGKDHAFDLIRDLPIFETQADHFLRVLERGRVATNVFLRRLHNFALDMGWLPWPVLPKKQWPKVEYGAKRAITWEEHRRIVEREQNPERRNFYELCWMLGGSQGDLANLRAEDIDWGSRVVSYRRQKTKTIALLHFGAEIAALLRQLPASGPLFPYLRGVRAADRATEFRQRCRGLGISGVTLHSYRYAWAERAKQCGYPERFAQEALGHNSKAVHRAYARRAQVVLPPLEEYERKQVNGNVVKLHFAQTKGTEPAEAQLARGVPTLASSQQRRREARPRA
ncbi:MAG: tyrosine-type recombinase/integrase [Verrucomicrobia bacterium]|nr:tyrosine-type recombinase/integrase [Verrucomicrobiota bacterium]